MDLTSNPSSVELEKSLTTGTALAVETVTKVYPARWGGEPLTAVDKISFNVAQGEILGLLGPNGAGKTTTIKMIAGLLLPTSGRILVGPYDVARDRIKAVTSMGAVLEGNRNLHWKLTLRENLQYFGTLKGVTHLKARMNEIIERLELGSHDKKLVGQLSRGLQQRVAIGIALLNRPRILLLDEPTLGLDVIAASTFKETIKSIAQDGCGIVLTTHQMEVAQALSNRIAVIAHGRLAVMNSLSELMAAYRPPGYEIVIRGGIGPHVWSQLAGLGAEAYTEEGALSRFKLPEDHPESFYRAIDFLRQAQIELVSAQQQEINLEAIYRRIIGDPA